MKTRQDITGIVVTFNEARRLRACLQSLRFCEQIIVADLGSSDSSVEIAAQCGAEILHRERVPIVEHIRQELTANARHDWIIFLDPDEVFPVNAEAEIKELIRRRPTLAVIVLGMQFYVLEKPLRCTIWGTVQEKTVICHRHEPSSRVWCTAPSAPSPATSGRCCQARRRIRSSTIGLTRTASSSRSTPDMFVRRDKHGTKAASASLGAGARVRCLMR